MKRPASMGNVRISNIIFQIPAEEFSQFERKYNDALVTVQDYIDNPENMNKIIDSNK